MVMMMISVTDDSRKVKQTAFRSGVCTACCRCDRRHCNLLTAATAAADEIELKTLRSRDQYRSHERIRIRSVNSTMDVELSTPVKIW